MSLEKKSATALSWHMEQDVSLKKNANCYQREQNVIVSNALDYKNSHKTHPNEEQKKEKKNFRHLDLSKAWQAVHC